MTEKPTPDADRGDPVPPDERRSSTRPTRRREQVIPRDPERSQPRGAGTDTPDRYGGPLRRRDDPPVRRAEGTGGEGGFGTRVGGTYYGEGFHHAGHGPRADRRSDESIQEEICELLTHHPDVHAGEIEVLVEGGEVTLQGSVEQRDARWLVEELVEAVSGVSLVHNRVRVAKR